MKIPGRILTVFFAVLISGGCSDYEAEVGPLIRAGKVHYQPLIEALEAYRKQNGVYPENLEDLVEAGFLDAVPSTPTAEAARPPGGPAYRRDADGKSFQLDFWYHLKNQGFGLGDTTYATWNSSKQQWTVSGPGSGGV